MASPAIISSIFQELQSFNQTRRTDLQQLAAALQSGNLDAAKQAFNDLAAIGQNGPNRNGEPFANSNRAQAFEAIGQALQSGNLAAAQTAFATLQNTFANQRNAAVQQVSPAVVVNIGGTIGGGGAANVAGAESIYQQLRDFRATRLSDIAQLGAALQSGNTNAAQQAYNALVTLGQNGPFGNSQPFQRADRAQAFNAIGTALQAGDLAAAQQAFTTLANSFEQGQLPPLQQPPNTEPPIPIGSGPTLTPPPVTTSAGPGANSLPVPEIVINVGGTGAQTGSATPEIVVNIAAGSNSSSNPEEVQINVGANGSGGQLTIDVNQAQNNAAHEQVTIDFLQQNNEYKVVLDLLNPSVHSPAQNSLLNVHA